MMIAVSRGRGFLFVRLNILNIADRDIPFHIFVTTCKVKVINMLKARIPVELRMKNTCWNKMRRPHELPRTCELPLNGITDFAKQEWVWDIFHLQSKVYRMCCD